MKRKETTCTVKVLNALRQADDFMSNAMLVNATGCSINQVSASLHHFRKCRVADVVVNPDGTGWWFALPPDSDSRTHTVEERTPESKPRKRRRKCTCVGPSHRDDCLHWTLPI